MVLSPSRVASNVTKQFSITLVCMGSCPLAIGPTLGTRFGLLQVFHSVWGEWLMLWAYSGGQKTQWCCFWNKMLIKFYSQFYICYTWALQWAVQVWTDSVKATSVATGWANEGVYETEVCPKRYTKKIYQKRMTERVTKRMTRGLYNVG